MMSPPILNGTDNDTNNNSSASNPISASKSRWPGLQSAEQDRRHIPRFIFDPDSCLVFYWTAAVAIATLYNAWTIALRIAFPEIRQERGLFYLYYVDMLSDFIYLMDIFMQLRTAYLQDGIPVFEPSKIRKQYMSQTYFVQDVISVIPSQTVLSLLPDAVGWCKYFLCTAGAARLTKLLKFHILYRFYDFAESFTSNPHLIRVLRLFLNLAIIIHWIACLYYLLSEYEGLGSNQWVYTNATDQQKFSRKYIICMYWSAMTLTTIGNTNSPETDVEYIFTGVIFLTGVFVFATVMGNVGDVISSMNANRQEFQARMDHIQMYLTHKKVPASLQLKIKKWAEYTWSRTKATDESRLLNMLPERLRAEVAVHVHLDSLKKVKIFEQCETGFLCELVLKLRSQVFSPGDYVCRAGETGREMFIINHGKVEVLVPSPATNKDMVVAVLSEGNYFGEISLLRLDGVQNRRTADVRSIGYSELLCLSRRDLMAALVEYPEAKSVLEVQAKKRMKTNLQAQRAFSVDTLMRSSQDSSSFDSGISTRDERGHDVSEIKAMIEELKNANKAPGKTVWQLITRCEVLQAKLSEKEKDIEDSKQRIKELEQLLFAKHYMKDADSSLPEHNESPSTSEKTLRPSGKVTKQYSQDEGRPVFKESSSFPQKESVPPRVIPDVKVTRPSETSDDESEPEKRSALKEDSCIKTSKITSISGMKSKSDKKSIISPESDNNAGSVSIRPEVSPGAKQSANLLNKVERQVGAEDGFKVYTQNIRSSHCNEDGSFSSETSLDHQIFFQNYDHMSVTTSFKDEIYLNDCAFNFDVHTIPEENEEELENAVCPSTYTDIPSYDTRIEKTPLKTTVEPSPNSIYRDLDQADQEVNCTRYRLGRSASTSADLCKTSRANTLAMKKLYTSLDGVNLDLYDSDSGINLQRLGSVGSYFSDESSSRRNSWNWDSEELDGDSEEGVSS